MTDDTPIVFHVTTDDLRQFEVSVDLFADWPRRAYDPDFDTPRWTWLIRPRLDLSTTTGHAVNATGHFHDTRAKAWAEMMGALLAVLDAQDGTRGIENDALAVGDVDAGSARPGQS